MIRNVTIPTRNIVLPLVNTATKDINKAPIQQSLAMKGKFI
ncbi:hypothetical protein [Bacillus sp. JCM 19041]